VQTVVTGPTAVGFWWKVSSSGGYGFLQLNINNSLQAQLTGEINWQQRSFYVPPGAQTVQWRYTQSGTSSAAQNAGWLDQVSLTNTVAPSFVTQPTNQTVSAGYPASLVSLASGTEPLAYQWQLNGTNVGGATSTILSLSDAQAQNAGGYTVVVSSPVGVVTSQVATLTVNASLPGFTLQPRSQSSYVGPGVSFTAAAKGTEPLSWQWYSNGVAVSAWKSTTATISPVRTSSFGGYWAVVTNSAGAATSTVATLEFTPLLAWGDNTYSQNVLPPGATNLLSFAGGDYHDLALRADGSVLAWGISTWGGTFLGQTNVPPNATNVTAIAAGAADSLGLRDDGRLLFWGQILFGTDSTVPAQATNVAALALGCGAQHALALRADGTVVEWGNTNYGLPDVPAGVTDVVSVAAGSYHSLALRADGTVVSWGYNPIMENPQVVPPTATNVVAIATGWFHNLALRADGTVVAWGTGTSFDADYGQANVPVQATNVVAIACGGNHSLALRRDGRIVAWGKYGQPSVPQWATNLVGIAGTRNGTLALIGSGRPMATSPLTSRWTVAGQPAFFYASAVGAWPLSFQWQFNGTNLTSGTNAWLTVANTSPAQAGLYSVVISNALGTLTNSGALLRVMPPQPTLAPNSGGLANGQFGFTATGPTGFVWVVQTSSNLLEWQDSTTLTNLTGVVTFSEPATNSPRFYRLKSAPF
jgi:alpha-tubulin suppressor-like RCC1 family protein